MKPHVLLSAYQCAPGQGSASQIGWEWYRRLSRRTRVTLATHIRNRAALEASVGPLQGAQILFVDTEAVAGPLHRTAHALFRSSEHAAFLMSSLDYFFYEHKLLRQLRAERLDFDVVHAVTPVSPAAASRLHTVGRPMIQGPLNGGLRTPWQFGELMGRDAAWLYSLRRLGRWLHGLTGSATGIDRFLCANAATIQALPESAQSRTTMMLENGLDLSVFQPQPWPNVPSDQSPLRLLFVGRLVPAKALDLLLQAVARVADRRPVILEVIGDGPMRGTWEQRAGDLGLGARVVFRATQPHAEIARALARCHVFCLPSVRESGGAVLLEAMAAGRPCIAVDWGGPAEVVDDRVGRLVSASGPDAVVQGFASALLDAASHPDDWRRRGLNGAARAAERYSWEGKIEQALQLYAGLVQEPALRRAV